MHERRRDPRNSKPYSLENLLRLRAEQGGLMLAVVGTADGFVMASSRGRLDKQGARLAAHVSSELRTRGATFNLEPPSWPHVRLLGMKIEVEGRPAFLAALVPAAGSFNLEELATGVKRILGQSLERMAA
jgi:hypothetical protein